MSKRSFWTTPANELSPVQLGFFFTFLGFLGLPIGGAIGFVLVEMAFYSADDLANQVAEGTHEIKWDINDFGTREVRIVEVPNDPAN